MFKNELCILLVDPLQILKVIITTIKTMIVISH